jgi:hypothetical protein
LCLYIRINQPDLATPLKRVKTEYKTTPSSGGKSLLISINKAQQKPHPQPQPQSQQKFMTQEELMQKLEDIHTTLWNHKFASVFQFPVSVEEAPDYDTVIKHRMDLTTLKQKLQNGVRW